MLKFVVKMQDLSEFNLTVVQWSSDMDVFFFLVFYNNMIHFNIIFSWKFVTHAFNASRRYLFLKTCRIKQMVIHAQSLQL